MSPSEHGSALRSIGIPGGTKVGEYWRTIDMLEQMTGKSSKEVMFILYFLSDIQYGNDDLRKMAKLIEDDLKLRGRL